MSKASANLGSGHLNKSSSFDAVIIGAGFSGLYQLHALRDQLGLSVAVIETASDVGGTWYWNRYPGARCDSESFYYSYSFSKELQNEWQWSEVYPEHVEIRRYLSHVADRFDLRRDIRFNTRVLSAAYDEASNLWTVRTDDDRSLTATFLISAVGVLSSANVPNIRGLDRFKGQHYHTGKWPHEKVDFSGKRVGLIGTGSTGIQAAPVIAAAAQTLTVFQRTANYSVPARNRPLTQEDRDRIRENYDALRQKARDSVNGHPFDINPQSALEVSNSDRQAHYEKAWEVGGLRFRASYRDLLTNKQANDTASEFIRNKIRSIVNDPETAAKLVPMDHPFASKRPPIDTNYFETFNLPNVSLVDVKATPITEITKHGIRTADTEYPLDIIVFATGFDAMTGSLLKIDIRGRNGRTLRDDWAAGPKSYMGLQIPGFPNFFTIMGPGSPSVLTNNPVAIEQHVEWITQCVRHIRENRLERIEASQDATDEWVAHVNEAAQKTLLPMANSSWYLGANVPGKPRVFMPYAGGMAHYADLCREIAHDGYRGFSLA
ncbi:flavin-containing monooxygenase [Paraburkholderia caribensis]|uniref:flavin-containing monooxygenase n=1 Tax=Paraburkholderia caribensis TaxID=75105 RepID=UPI00078C5E69|nr:NAD(P)/FAD-dependent oxidoreductase [Paraburkholderia caribensis]AMV48330.1 cyclohexanone monooxygenase [Paraburkholderia caribensis]